MFLQAQSEEQLDGETVVLSPPKETKTAEQLVSAEKVPETPKVSEELATELPHLEVSEVSESTFPSIFFVNSF